MGVVAALAVTLLVAVAASLDALKEAGFEVDVISPEAGEIRGLINICSNPMVSWPDQARVRRILEGLEPTPRQLVAWGRGVLVRMRKQGAIGTSKVLHQEYLSIYRPRKTAISLH